MPVVPFPLEAMKGHVWRCADGLADRRGRQRDRFMRKTVKGLTTGVKASDLSKGQVDEQVGAFIVAVQNEINRRICCGWDIDEPYTG